MEKAYNLYGGMVIKWVGMHLVPVVQGRNTKDAAARKRSSINERVGMCCVSSIPTYPPQGGTELSTLLWSVSIIEFY